MEDIAILKPTFFPAVPRILNKIYDKITEGIGKLTGLKAWFINKAISSKMEAIQNGQGFTHKFYDAVLFSKFRKVLGGRVRFMGVGSAPIEKNVLDFMKVCFCCSISEGYGLTESMAGGCGSIAENPESGVVGGPGPYIKLRLRDIPEMNYLSTDNPPRGEICLFGQ